MSLEGLFQQRLEDPSSDAHADRPDMKTPKSESAPSGKLVDTTGAGDAFNAGYLAACLRGADIARALQEGIEIASAAIASSPRHYHRTEFSHDKLDSDAIRST